LSRENKHTLFFKKGQQKNKQPENCSDDQVAYLCGTQVRENLKEVLGRF